MNDDDEKPDNEFNEEDELGLVFPINDVDTFCQDTRIVVHDFVMGNLAKNTNIPYVPLLNPEGEHPSFDELSKAIQKDIDKSLPKEVTMSIIKKKLKYDEENCFYLLSEEIYSKLWYILSQEYFQRMFSSMVEDGLAELCCDKGDVFYRLTKKFCLTKKGKHLKDM